MKRLLIFAILSLVCAVNATAQEANDMAKVEKLPFECAADVAQVDNDTTKVRKRPFVCHINEVMPQFPGGDEAFCEYVKKNMVYPEEARKKGVEGSVVLTFSVECDGSISNIEIVKSTDPCLNEEALRLINSMPKWIPGSRNGKTVRVKMCVPVKFRL